MATGIALATISANCRQQDDVLPPPSSVRRRTARVRVLLDGELVDLVDMEYTSYR